MEYEINLVELCKHILKKWRILLISTIVFCLLAIGYATIKTKTYYKSKSVITVNMEDAKVPVQNTNIIKRDDVVSYCINKIGSTTSEADAKKNIAVYRYDFSNDVIIEYSSLNEGDATNFLRALIDYGTYTINNIPGYNVSVKEYAKLLGSYKVGVSKKIMSVAGALLGCLLSMLVIVIKYLLDNKVRDRGLVERVLGYKVLSDMTIPQDDIKKLYANMLFGYGDKRVISISGFCDEVEILSDSLANYISDIKGNVLLLVENQENAKNIEELVKRNVNKELKKKDKGVVCISSYNDIDSITDRILSESGSEFIDELKKQYEYIIISTPTKRVNTIFNAISDGTVLIVKKDNTKVADIVELKEQLEIVNADVLGVVFIN